MEFLLEKIRRRRFGHRHDSIVLLVAVLECKSRYFYVLICAKAYTVLLDLDMGRVVHELITWNIMIRPIDEEREKPNEVTVVVVLAACADLGALDLGKRVHEYSNRCGFGRNVCICNTLIDMFIKCGCLEVANRVFSEMGDRTIVSWSAMIGGFTMHDGGEEALELFAKMNRIGNKPNGVTFVRILHACNHMGLLISEGHKFFSSITP
ncbi:hypothetical protein GIB67_017020 [Kingdonia uniflora]|uniref:Pentatricopeptide repeat-containing protein n=1 Tax=Kingdonia uniflora TaxID=39325 RepID=A0A7J7LRV0_9MAGN|nr:hypothetical protein GIB67_017020 [Kingdonia uniflora]